MVKILIKIAYIPNLKNKESIGIFLIFRYTASAAGSLVYWNAQQAVLSAFLTLKKIITAFFAFLDWDVMQF